jgi:DNA-directed RNA polymerase specialized sigma24 family protein/AmiR/NasT family two-component response regulator
MTFTNAIAPELPFLRRYARALTGSQALGDAAVREVLEAILEAPEEFKADNPPRLELYRIFHQIGHRELIDPLSEGQAQLDGLDTMGRRALLLTAVEGFGLSEVAVILHTSTEIIETRLENARSQIAQMIRSKVLIIEDEAVIALHIRAIVTSEGHEVLGIAQTRREAVDMTHRLRPELILADISLADGSSGIDAANEILADFDVPIIFVTAFPERLLTGERPEPTYLITKPFEPVMLNATIAQALMSRRERELSLQNADATSAPF